MFQIHRHLLTHKELKHFQCGYCKKRFSKVEELRVHIDSIHGDGQEQVRWSQRWYSQKTCEICQHNFANSKTLSKHIKQVHNKIKPFICKICGYTAARKSTREIHERNHTGEKPLICKVEHCEFRAADPSVLAKHEQRHKNEIVPKIDEIFFRNYKCPSAPGCTYSTIQASALKNHVRVKHIEIFNSQIKCDQCNFTSVNTKMLAQHKLDHKSGLIRPVVTEDCDSIETTISDHKFVQSISQPSRNLNTTNRPSHHHDISSDDCFLPIESTNDSLQDVFSGGVTIPANSEDYDEVAQFPN